MSDSVTPVAPEAGSEPQPAFVQAVADLGARREVKTSQPIYNAQGIKLLEGGVTIDQTLYDRLVSHRLSLPLDECIDPGPGVEAASLEAAARAATARWPFFARVAPEGAAGKSLLDAVAAVRLAKPVALHLTLARETRPALFDHSILMALLCAHLVRESGGAKVDVREAAVAGLLHDLGMLHIAPGLLDSEERLSGDELRPVYVHPLTSSMLVDRFPEYSKEIVRAIVEHHERLDGSGYPRGLAGDALSPLGRVLALAEVVTAMFDGTRRLPEQRVSLLLRINPRRYDAGHVATIHRLLAVPAEASDAEGIGAEALIARLLQLTDVLALWRASSETLGRALDGAQAALVASVDAQNATLQRMLYDAGVTREQLGSIAGEVESDAALRIELWAIAEELLWQLHAAANQLKRRWRGADAGAPHPGDLTAWFAAVAALDAPPAAALSPGALSASPRTARGAGQTKRRRRSSLPSAESASRGRWVERFMYHVAPALPSGRTRRGARDNRRMDFIGMLIDFVLHVDVHLATFVRSYGTWVYALLFAIIFVETGVVVMPFLPGDSLLFVVGAMCAVGLMSLPLVIGLLWLAAVLGDQCNYADRPQGRAARVRLGALALVQQEGLRPGARVLRALRRRDDRRRALPAVPAHLRAVRRRGRGDDAQPLHSLQRLRRRALGRLARRLPATCSATSRG